MNDSHEQSKPARAWVWPAIIIGLLGSHVMMCVTVVAIANSDPAFAVVDDYHQKALDWDAQVAAVRASDALGWSADLRVGDDGDALNRRSITLTLTDASGEPIRRAAVLVEAFAHSRASERVEVTLHGGEPGTFVGFAPLPRRGVWEFRVTARRGEDMFMLTRELDVD